MHESVEAMVARIDERTKGMRVSIDGLTQQMRETGERYERLLDKRLEHLKGNYQQADQELSQRIDDLAGAPHARPFADTAPLDPPPSPAANTGPRALLDYESAARTKFWVAMAGLATALAGGVYVLVERLAG